MTSSRVDTAVSGAPVGASPETGPSKNQSSDLTSIEISRDTLSSDSARAKESPATPLTAERATEKDPSLGVIGTDIDAERRKNSEPILGLDIDKVTEDHKAANAAIAARHEELQNAGFEDASAPAGIANAAHLPLGVSLAGRSAQQQREMLQGESLLFTGKSKKKSGDPAIDDFIELHPELLPLVVIIQQELAAVERAKSAGETGLESKSNLEAALDRVATLLEGQPLAPQLRLGDRSVKESLIHLLTDGKPEEVKVAEVVIDDIQRRLAAKGAAPSHSFTREALERFVKEAERIGRFQGLTLAEGSASRSGAEAGIADAHASLDKALKESGCDAPEVRELLVTIERQAAERERMARVSERIYELQLQVSVTEGRAANSAAIKTLQDYISDQRDLLERHPGYREELKNHQQAARSEGTKLLRSCREAAAEIERASHYSVFTGGTDEAAIFKALEGRSQREVKLIDELFREDFGKGGYSSVEGLLTGEMGGGDLARALKAFRGDGAPSGTTPRPLDTATLAALGPSTDTNQALDAIVSRDTVRSTALALRSAASTGGDPVLSMVEALESAKVRGVEVSALAAELERIGFDPAQAVGRDPAENGAEVPQREAIGRVLIEEALSTGIIDDEKLFAYAQFRAMEHGGKIGSLEAEESVPVERIARLNGTYAADMRALVPFLERHPETSAQLEEISKLATTQVRAELINQRIVKLASDVGVREYNAQRDPELVKEAQAKLDTYLASKRDVIAAVPGHEAAIDPLIQQGKARGKATIDDVANAVSKYNIATDHWFSFMADGDKAAEVLRGKSSEWLVLFKEEFERVHGSNTAIGVANGILSGAEFDRVHSLMHRDRIGAIAADVEISMSHWNGANREEFVAAVQSLKSDKDRAEFREVFDPRYARNHSITVARSDAGSPDGVSTEILVAKNFDQAVDYAFDGDGEVVAKAAFEGDEALVDAALVHEGLRSTFDPASKGAKALDQLRTPDGKLDHERIEQAQVAYERHYKSDIKTDVDSIGGLRFNEEPGKVWAKAIVEGDETLVAAAKVRSGVMGAGTEKDDIRAVFTMSPELGALVNQIEQGSSLSAEQIAALTDGRGVTRGDVRAILEEVRNKGYQVSISPEIADPLRADEPATAEMIALLTNRDILPKGIQTALRAGEIDQGALLAAYAGVLEAQVEHRAEVAAIDKRYAEAFGGASIKNDLRGDLGEWDLRYVETLRASGAVPRAYRYIDACDGLGTEEQALRELTRGRTREEIETDRLELRRLASRNLDAMVLSEVSGDLYFDINEDLGGIPQTMEEKGAAADRRMEHEKSGYVEGWFDSYEKMEHRYAELKEAIAQRDSAAVDQAFIAFNTAADSFRGAKNATADMVANVGATVVIVAGVVTVVAVTGGAGAVPLMCVAAGGGGVRIGTKMALKGDAYGLEEGAVDVGVAAVDVAVMGIMPFASVGQAAGNQVLLQGGKSIASRGGVAALTEEGAALTGKQALIQMGQGSRLVRVAAGSAQGAVDGALVAPLQTGVVTALHEETWQNGFADGLKTIAVNGVVMIPVGAALGAPFGGAIGLKTPAQLKLGRPLTPREATVAINPPEGGPLVIDGPNGSYAHVPRARVSPRAQETLNARLESKGFITEADRIDADLMSSALSKSRSQKVVAQAKEAAKAGKMSDGEVQALEQQLRVDGRLTKFEARAVQKALDPKKFQEPVTVMTRKMLDSHLKEANEVASTLRKNLARDGISEVEVTSLNSRLASVERRIDALNGVENAFKETEAMAAALSAPKTAPKPASTPLDDRADGEIAAVGRKVRTEPEASKDGAPEPKLGEAPKDVDGAVPGGRSAEAPVAEAPTSAAEPVSADVLLRQGRVVELDERIAGAEKFLAHERSLIEKARASAEPDVVEVAPGLKVPRKEVEAGHLARQKEIEGLRVEREAAVSDVKARQDLEQSMAESRARAAERAAEIRAESARNEASAAEARRAEVARRMNERAADVEPRGAEVRSEAEASLRRREDIHREFLDRMAHDRGSPVERYVPKAEKPKTDLERVVEIDDALTRNGNHLKFLEQKLTSSGDESMTFDGFTMSRADVEANVQSLRQENIALAAERENLTRIDFAPRPTRSEPRPVEARESDPVSATPRSDGENGGFRNTPRQEPPKTDLPTTSEPAPRAAPRPERQPVAEPARSQVQVLEREANPDLERLLAQIESMPPIAPKATSPVEIVEPSPAIAKKLTQAQDKIAELEAAHVRYEGKRGAQEVIEDELQKARQVLQSLDERASLQSDLKRAIREADEDAASVADIAARNNLRRDLSRLEAKVNADEGDIDLGAIEGDVAALRSGMRGTTPAAVPARASSADHLSVSETDDLLAQVFERNPDLYMSLASKIDAEGRLSLHSIRETYAENGLELPREFGGSGELAPPTRAVDEDGFFPVGDDTSPDVEPGFRGGDEGGGGTATMTKPKTEVKPQTELDEPELDIVPETQAPATKPKVEEPEVKTAPKTEEKTEVAPVRPAVKPVEEVRVVTETETSTAVDTETHVSTGTGFKLQARPNSNTKVIPKVSAETAVQTALQTGIANQAAQATKVGTGTRYPDEPPPGSPKRHWGGSGHGEDTKQRHEEITAKLPEAIEEKTTPKKVAVKEHEARKGRDTRNKLVGEDVDGKGTYIIGDLQVGWEKFSD